MLYFRRPGDDSPFTWLEWLLFPIYALACFILLAVAMPLMILFTPLIWLYSWLYPERRAYEADSAGTVSEKQELHEFRARWRSMNFGQRFLKRLHIRRSGR